MLENTFHSSNEQSVLDQVLFYVLLSNECGRGLSAVRFISEFYRFHFCLSNPCLDYKMVKNTSITKTSLLLSVIIKRILTNGRSVASMLDVVTLDGSRWIVTYILADM